MTDEELAAVEAAGETLNLPVVVEYDRTAGAVSGRIVNDDGFAIAMLLEMDTDGAAVEVTDPEAEAMAVALNAAPRLLAEVRRLRERLAAFESCDRARQAAEEEVVALKADAERWQAENAAWQAMTCCATPCYPGAGPWAALAASQAEVVRLAGLAREACDLAESFADDAREYGPVPPRIAALRVSISTPDPAAFVAAVDELIESVRVHEGAGPGFGSQALDAVIKARSALLKMGGVR